MRRRVLHSGLRHPATLSAVKTRFLPGAWLYKDACRKAVVLCDTDAGELLAQRHATSLGPRFPDCRVGKDVC